MRDMMPFLIPILTSLGFFIMVGWIVWVDARRRQMQSKSIAELQSQLLERFGSAQEFVAFSQTEEGRRFLSTLASQRLNPLERILRSVRIGVILTIVGLGGLLLAMVYRFDEEGFTIAGIVLALGIGFLVSAGVSYRLSKSWGLLTADEASKQSNLVSERKAV